MKKLLSIGSVALLGLAASLVTACSQSHDTVVSKTEATEYISGTKRWSAPYMRETDGRRRSEQDIGVADRTIEIKAAIAGWDPKEFTVKKDEIVELKLIGTDNGSLPAITGVKRFTGHGFHIYSYDIWVNGLRAGVERSIKFKASEAGTYPFECVVFCSTDHYKMCGEMIVTE